MTISEKQANQLRAIRRRNQAILAEGCALAQTAASLTPPATLGILTDGFDEWKPGNVYTEGQLFRYDGMTGFVRQPSVTAQEHQPPFSTGMESVYGVRPKPDIDGVYPYTYNMAVSLDMRVREDDAVYVCIQPIDPLLYPPSQSAAHFTKEETE